MKRHVIVIFLAVLMTAALTGCINSEKTSDVDCGNEKIVVKISAVAIADGNRTVHFYFFKPGGESFYVERSPRVPAKVSCLLCPGQFARVNAAFERGQATPENTSTLTYEEALSDSIPYSNTEFAKYTCEWKPQFDLTGVQ